MNSKTAVFLLATIAMTMAGITGGGSASADLFTIEPGAARFELPAANTEARSNHTSPNDLCLPLVVDADNSGFIDHVEAVEVVAFYLLGRSHPAVGRLLMRDEVVEVITHFLTGKPSNCTNTLSIKITVLGTDGMPSGGATVRVYDADSPQHPPISNVAFTPNRLDGRTDSTGEIEFASVTVSAGERWLLVASNFVNGQGFFVHETLEPRPDVVLDARSGVPVDLSAVSRTGDPLQSLRWRASSPGARPWPNLVADAVGDSTQVHITPGTYYIEAVNRNHYLVDDSLNITGASGVVLDPRTQGAATVAFDLPQVATFFTKFWRLGTSSTACCSPEQLEPVVVTPGKWNIDFGFQVDSTDGFDWHYEYVVNPDMFVAIEPWLGSLFMGTLEDGDSITVRGDGTLNFEFETPPESLPGDSLIVRFAIEDAFGNPLSWISKSPSGEPFEPVELTISATLVNSSQIPVLERDLPLWERGWRLDLPGDLPAGTYQVRIGLPNPDGPLVGTVDLVVQ